MNARQTPSLRIFDLSIVSDLLDEVSVCLIGLKSVGLQRATSWVSSLKVEDLEFRVGAKDDSTVFNEQGLALAKSPGLTWLVHIFERILINHVWHYLWNVFESGVLEIKPDNAVLFFFISVRRVASKHQYFPLVILEHTHVHSRYRQGSTSWVIESDCFPFFRLLFAFLEG